MTAAINLQMALFGGLLKLPKRRLNRKGFSLAPNWKHSFSLDSLANHSNSLNFNQNILSNFAGLADDLDKQST